MLSPYKKTPIHKYINVLIHICGTVYKLHLDFFYRRRARFFYITRFLLVLRPLLAEQCTIYYIK